MTTLRTPVAGPAPDAPTATELPHDPALVDEAFRQLGRAAKTRQLYLPNNPIYQKALDNVAQAFAALWRVTEEVTVAVGETDFRWERVPVGHEPNKSESLAWLLYKDGLRSLTLQRGFEQDELVLLLDLLQRVRHASPDQDDLLTLLWEQDFLYLRYHFVDLSMEGLQEIEPSTATATPTRVQVVVEEQERPRPGVVRMEDFDSALYFLDEEEVEYLRREIAAEYRQDLRRNILAILFDVYEVEGTPPIRDEISEILETLMLQFLSAGEFGAVALLIREAAVAAERAPSLSAAHRERLLRLSDRLSVPEVLSQVLQTLDESHSLPPQEDLEALFQQLRGGTLATLLAWMGRIQNPTLRAVLGPTASRLAGENITELARLTLSTNPQLAAEAIRRAGELKATAAITPLAKVLGSPDPALRLATVHALAEIGSPTALKLIEGIITDPERDVRVSAIRALGARQHRAALPLVENLVRGKWIREADLTEKLAVFETYAVLAGADGIETLDGMLNARGFFRREDPEVRACAATALGRVGTPAALDAIRKAAMDRDVLVRNAVNKVLRGTPP